MMKFFQRLGKALMLPVACLPVCGILMGIGYILAPAAMAGEVQGFTAGGLSYSIGLFLIKAGGALIDNMSWLFAIGVAVGMADDSDGTAGLAGLVSMYMDHYALKQRFRCRYHRSRGSSGVRQDREPVRWYCFRSDRCELLQ